MVCKTRGHGCDAAAAVCATSLTTAAWACGDKLVALGGGVGFDRVMVSRNPGHIILMLEPSTGPHRGERQDSISRRR